jgi:hypothetical protein
MRQEIERVLRSFGVPFSDQDVEGIESRYQSYRYVFTIRALPHIIARNWAIDQLRKIERDTSRSKQLQIKQAADELDRARFERALRDFDALVPTLKSLRQCMPLALQYMRLTCLEGKKDKECVKSFPGSTRDQRYQWLKRARDLVLPHASEDLVFFLEKRMKKKEVFVAARTLKCKEYFRDVGYGKHDDACLYLCVEKKMHIVLNNYHPSVRPCDGSCEPKDYELNFEDVDPYIENELVQAIGHFEKTGHACGFARKGGLIDFDDDSLGEVSVHDPEHW